tara:strand:+ start:22440 stop:22661 length:222 start_codon:yes stop_codon:yes gene_type:complete
MTVPTWDELHKALELVSIDHWSGRRITRERAKSKGLRLFFTGNPCIKGHYAERVVSSGNCLMCLKNKWRGVTE